MTANLLSRLPALLIAILTALETSDAEWELAPSHWMPLPSRPSPL